MKCSVPCIVAQILAFALIVSCSAPAAGQYHPAHPQVIEMVDRAIEFLTADFTNNNQHAGNSILRAIAIFKATGDAEHALVKHGLEMALNSIQSATTSYYTYEVAIAFVLLAALDPQTYRPQLEEGLQWLTAVQKPHGGFGYRHESLGDTSQVQYAMLAAWSLHQAGVQVPTEILHDTIDYLAKTQDISGSWGYKGRIAQTGLVPQTEVSKSLGTAGICGLLLACDQLSLFGSSLKLNQDLPNAFMRIDDKENAIESAQERIRASEEIRRLAKDAIERSFKYQDNSGPQGAEWHYYWRYGQERYESLREVVDGKQQSSPSWYNEGVEALARDQNKDGSWRGQGHTSGCIDTSFAILYLIRSTQKAIGKLDSGITFGGDGSNLPTDLSSIRMEGDKVVSNKDASVEGLLSLMEEQHSRVSEGMLPNNLMLSKNAQERTNQIARLSRLLDSQDPIARRLAARLLGRSEDLGVVPDLIYALSDPDGHVPRLAEESLRLLSRHLNSVHLALNPTPEDRSAAINYWKRWYQDLRPDYIFIER